MTHLRVVLVSLLFVGSVMPASAQSSANTPVYEFRSGSPGPCAAPVQASDGRLYGATTAMPGAVPGGASFGEIFRIDPAGTPGNYSVLHALPLDGSEGKDLGPFVQAGDGNFYTTATNGGTFGKGAILRITPSGQVAVVKSFDPSQSDGVNPMGGLSLASDGFLYGTTNTGGSFSQGTVFRMATNGAFVTLKALTGNNGAQPQSPPVQASDGALYGLASDKFYRVALDGTYTVVASGLNTGSNSLSGLTAATDGNFYYTRRFGGLNQGAVVRITTGGVATDLYSFSGSEDTSPLFPNGGVVQGGDGRLYGTTPWGGTGHPGTGFLYAVSLAGSLDRAVPLATAGGSSLRHVTPLSDGSYFVATCRDLQRFTPPSTMSVWRAFEDGGYYPLAAPIEGRDGNLYGTTSRGGANDYGTAYRLTRAGVLTTLASFDATLQTPSSQLVEGTDGNFYGVSTGPQIGNVSPSLFRLSPAGVLTKIADLPPGQTLVPFSASLVDGGDGLIYGVTSHGEQDFNCGTAFTLSMAGVVTRMGVFNRDVCHPAGQIVRGSDGNFYGRTFEGYDRSGNALGTTFRLTRSGVVTGGVTVPSSVGANPATRDGTRYGVSSGGALGGGRVYREPPDFTADRSSLSFGAVSNGSGFERQTSDQIVRLTQTGTGSVAWTVTANQPWMRVSPASGSGSGSIAVGVQPAPGVPVSGTVSGTVTITATGAAAAVQVIAVTLTVTPVGNSRAPYGVWDYPADNATVSGSVALTGWALDDLEVRRVRIVRDPVAGERPGPIPVGDAVMVDGARPDVVAVFPDAPRATSAGWGYLLLTNVLPGQGNGTFTFYAYADDVDGNTSLLGRRTIVAANATATKPFGAIDTPGQGEIVSGTNYPNYGWVLARGTKRADPPGGGTVQVYIDGLLVGSPGGWTSRSDLTATFPPAQYSGVSTALGVFVIDTTTLTNGVHTIGWVVTDNQGAAEGVGSRYFTVANGAASSLVVSPAPLQTADGVPRATDPVLGRAGFAESAPLRRLRMDHDVSVIETEELGRIELKIPGESVSAIGPLPMGAQLDPATGVFIWQPGVGFVGVYELSFVSTHDGAPSRTDVRIVLKPRGTAMVR